MIPSAHLLISWISTVELLRNRRERCIVALAGVVPDLDGIGLLVDKVVGTTAYYSKYHHYLGHSLFSAIFIGMAAALLAKTQKVLVFILGFVVVHLHILCDVLGSRGTDGYQWPVYYLYPLSSEYSIAWSHQWELTSWQNRVVMFILVGISLYYAHAKKITVLEVFSIKLNIAAINMFNRYFRKNA